MNVILGACFCHVGPMEAGEREWPYCTMCSQVMQPYVGEPPCVHCRELRLHHGDDCCLFAPTVYAASMQADWVVWLKEMTRDDGATADIKVRR